MAQKRKLEREGVRLHYRAYEGRGAMAVQYADTTDMLNDEDVERRVIYVGFTGEEGRPLIDVLEENARLRRLTELDPDWRKSIDERLTQLAGVVQSISVGRKPRLGRRPLYTRWPFRLFRRVS